MTLGTDTTEAGEHIVRLTVFFRGRRARVGQLKRVSSPREKKS